MRDLQIFSTELNPEEGNVLEVKEKKLHKSHLYIPIPTHNPERSTLVYVTTTPYLGVSKKSLTSYQFLHKRNSPSPHGGLQAYYHFLIKLPLEKGA